MIWRILIQVNRCRRVCCCWHQHLSFSAVTSLVCDQPRRAIYLVSQRRHIRSTNFRSVPTRPLRTATQRGKLINSVVFVVDRRSVQLFSASIVLLSLSVSVYAKTNSYNAFAFKLDRARSVFVRFLQASCQSFV